MFYAWVCEVIFYGLVPCRTKRSRWKWRTRFWRNLSVNGNSLWGKRRNERRNSNFLSQEKSRQRRRSSWIERKRKANLENWSSQNRKLLLIKTKMHYSWTNSKMYYKSNSLRATKKDYFRKSNSLLLYRTRPKQSNSCQNSQSTHLLRLSTSQGQAKKAKNKQKSGTHIRATSWSSWRQTKGQLLLWCEQARKKSRTSWKGCTTRTMPSSKSQPWMSQPWSQSKYQKTLLFKLRAKNITFEFEA